ENFTPYPKNPIIAKFFVNIGYADSLGSGVRNLYKYTKIYSDAEPNFEEDDVFRLFVPMRPAGATLTSDRKNSEVTKVSEKVTDVTEKRIIELLKDNSKYKTTELAEKLDISRKTVSIKLKNLREKGIIERVGSDRKGYWNIYL
ncbi:MAG: winged helix-turn-helix transcriptional regulator, partial [Lachnospiraceae bacterium]|nr:winged helix-turn-helix transcriptional regulator [Lachnospiraceae bacterium]